MNVHELTAYIKAEALRLGFDACGVARAQQVSASVQQIYLRGVNAGYVADMDYLRRNEEMRFNPTLLVPGTQSIICVAMNYYPSRPLDDSTYQLAWYAYGQDYHTVVKNRLQQLMQQIRQACPNADGRCFCDTAPVMEKYWAEQAGLGWRGRHTQLIIKGLGTTFFLGEIFLNQELEYDTPLTQGCGSCRKCQEACPTHALCDDEETHHPMLDARKCLSYQTIENHGQLSDEARSAMGNCIYGCDKCQQACPHNHTPHPTTEVLFQPSEALLSMKPCDWQNLTVEQYRQLFKGSAVKRAKYEGLKRNIEAVEELRCKN